MSFSRCCRSLASQWRSRHLIVRLGSHFSHAPQHQGRSTSTRGSFRLRHLLGLLLALHLQGIDKSTERISLLWVNTKRNSSMHVSRRTWWLQWRTSRRRIRVRLPDHFSAARLKNLPKVFSLPRCEHCGFFQCFCLLVEITLKWLCFFYLRSPFSCNHWYV